MKKSLFIYYMVAILIGGFFASSAVADGNTLVKLREELGLSPSPM